jgi:hypothetical protein
MKQKENRTHHVPNNHLFHNHINYHETRGSCRSSASVSNMLCERKINFNLKKNVQFVKTYLESQRLWILTKWTFASGFDNPFPTAMGVSFTEHWRHVLVEHWPKKKGVKDWLSGLVLHFQCIFFKKKKKKKKIYTISCVGVPSKSIVPLTLEYVENVCGQPHCLCSTLLLVVLVCAQAQ